MSYPSMLAAWSCRYNRRGSWEHEDQTASDTSSYLLFCAALLEAGPINEIGAKQHAYTAPRGIDRRGGGVGVNFSHKQEIL